MRGDWLHHEGGHEELILYYGGWAVGHEALRHLQSPADVLALSDYRSENLAAPLAGDPAGTSVAQWLARYRRVSVVAYSMGVAVAARHLAQPDWPGPRPRAATAICGTPDPRAAIGAEIFDSTLTQLSAPSLARFLRRAGATPQHCPDLAALQEELRALRTRAPGATGVFDRVIATSADRIFRPAAMSAAWGEAVIDWHEGPHHPFAQWQHWRELTP